MVAARIRSFLAERQISQAELARRMKISPQALHTILVGNPTMATLERIASALGVSPQDLFPSDNLRPAPKATAADVVAMIESCPDPDEAVRFCLLLLKREKLYQQRVSRRKRIQASADGKPDDSG
jgi:transcriptional regulator with XRE-family HTH domain